MKQDGPTAGLRSAVYKAGCAFFHASPLNAPSNSGPVDAGSSNTAKRAKKDDAATFMDVSGVVLPGEEYGRVPVFDTCNEVRKKIRAFLKKEGVTQAGLCRELTKVVAHRGRKVNASSMANFMCQNGPSGGAGSIVFYAAYVYFEKMRIRDGKPKSQMRNEMENVWGAGGMDLPREGTGGQRYLTCFANERPYEDKYGKIHFLAESSCLRWLFIVCVLMRAIALLQHPGRFLLSPSFRVLCPTPAVFSRFYYVNVSSFHATDPYHGSELVWYTHRLGRPVSF